MRWSQADGPALGVDPGAEPMQKERPVPAGAHVVLPGPLELDRESCRPGPCRLRRLDQIVGGRVGASTEGPAREEHVDLDLLGLEAQDLGHRRLVGGLELLPVPDPHARLRGLDDAVQGLHGRVGEVGDAVLGLDHLGGTGQGRRPRRRPGGRPRRGSWPAPGSGPGSRRSPRSWRATRPSPRRRASRPSRAVQKSRAMTATPLGISATRSTPGMARASVSMDVLDPGAEAGRVHHQGRQHLGQAHVLGEDGAAVGLGRPVLAAELGVADQPELGRVLELDLRRHRLPGRRLRQLAEACADGRPGGSPPRP